MKNRSHPLLSGLLKGLLVTCFAICSGLWAQSKSEIKDSTAPVAAIASQPEMNALNTAPAPEKLTLKPESVLATDVMWQGRQLNLMAYSPDFPKENALSSLQSKTGRAYEPAPDSMAAMQFLNEHHRQAISERLAALEKELNRNDLERVPVLAKSEPQAPSTPAEPQKVASTSPAQTSSR